MLIHSAQRRLRKRHFYRFTLLGFSEVELNLNPGNPGESDSDMARQQMATVTGGRCCTCKFALIFLNFDLLNRFFCQRTQVKPLPPFSTLRGHASWLRCYQITRMVSCLHNLASLPQLIQRTVFIGCKMFACQHNTLDYLLRTFWLLHLGFTWAQPYFIANCVSCR